MIQALYREPNRNTGNRTGKRTTQGIIHTIHTERIRTGIDKQCTTADDQHATRVHQRGEVDHQTARMAPTTDADVTTVHNIQDEARMVVVLMIGVEEVDRTTAMAVPARAMGMNKIMCRESLHRPLDDQDLTKAPREVTVRREDMTLLLGVSVLPEVHRHRYRKEYEAQAPTTESIITRTCRKVIVRSQSIQQQNEKRWSLILMKLDSE